MLYAKFIRLAEEHAEQLTKNWITEVKNNPMTTGYKKMPDQLLSKRIYDVYERLGHWLLEPDNSKIGEHYIRLGRERASEGLKISEVTYALILSRVVLWKYILNQGIIDSFFDLQQAFEFYQMVINFYDRANYLVALGFESHKSLEKEEFEKGEFINEAVDSITRWLIK